MKNFAEFVSLVALIWLCSVGPVGRKLSELLKPEKKLPVIVVPKAPKFVPPPPAIGGIFGEFPPPPKSRDELFKKKPSRIAEELRKLRKESNARWNGLLDPMASARKWAFFSPEVQGWEEVSRRVLSDAGFDQPRIDAEVARIFNRFSRR